MASTAPRTSTSDAQSSKRPRLLADSRGERTRTVSGRGAAAVHSDAARSPSGPRDNAAFEFPRYLEMEESRGKPVYIVSINLPPDGKFVHRLPPGTSFETAKHVRDRVLLACLGVREASKHGLSFPLSTYEDDPFYTEMFGADMPPSVGVHDPELSDDEGIERLREYLLGVGVLPPKAQGQKSGRPEVPSSSPAEREPGGKRPRLRERKAQARTHDQEQAQSADTDIGAGAELPAYLYMDRHRRTSCFRVAIFLPQDKGRVSLWLPRETSLAEAKRVRDRVLLACFGAEDAARRGLCFPLEAYKSERFYGQLFESEEPPRVGLHDPSLGTESASERLRHYLLMTSNGETANGHDAPVNGKESASSAEEESGAVAGSSSAAARAPPLGVHVRRNRPFKISFHWRALLDEGDAKDAKRRVNITIRGGRDRIDAARMRDRLVIACTGIVLRDAHVLNHPLESYKNELFYRRLFESPDPPKVGYWDPQPGTPGARGRLLEFMRSVGAIDATADSERGKGKVEEAAEPPPPPPAAGPPAAARPKSARGRRRQADAENSGDESAEGTAGPSSVGSRKAKHAPPQRESQEGQVEANAGSSRASPADVHLRSDLSSYTVAFKWHGLQLTIYAGRDLVGAGRIRDRLALACIGDTVGERYILNYPLESYQNERFYKELFESKDPPKVGFRDPEQGTVAGRERMLAYLREVGAIFPADKRGRPSAPAAPAAPSPAAARKPAPSRASAPPATASSAEEVKEKPSKKSPAATRKRKAPPPAKKAASDSESSESHSEPEADAGSSVAVPAGVFSRKDLSLMVVYNWNRTSITLHPGRGVSQAVAGRIRDRIAIACMGDIVGERYILNHPIETYKSERFYKELFESKDPPMVGFRDPEAGTAPARARLLAYLQGIGALGSSTFRCSLAGAQPPPASEDESAASKCKLAPQPPAAKRSSASGLPNGVHLRKDKTLEVVFVWKEQPITLPVGSDRYAAGRVRDRIAIACIGVAVGEYCGLNHPLESYKGERFYKELLEARNPPKVGFRDPSAGSRPSCDRILAYLRRVGALSADAGAATAAPPVTRSSRRVAAEAESEPESEGSDGGDESEVDEEEDEDEKEGEEEEAPRPSGQDELLPSCLYLCNSGTFTRRSARYRVFLSLHEKAGRFSLLLPPRTSAGEAKRVRDRVLLACLGRDRAVEEGLCFPLENYQSERFFADLLASKSPPAVGLHDRELGSKTAARRLRRYLVSVGAAPPSSAAGAATSAIASPLPPSSDAAAPPPSEAAGSGASPPGQKRMIDLDEESGGGTSSSDEEGANEEDEEEDEDSKPTADRPPKARPALPKYLNVDRSRGRAHEVYRVSVSWPHSDANFAIYVPLSMDLQEASRLRDRVLLSVVGLEAAVERGLCFPLETYEGERFFRELLRSPRPPRVGLHDPQPGTRAATERLRAYLADAGAAPPQRPPQPKAKPAKLPAAEKEQPKEEPKAEPKEEPEQRPPGGSRPRFPRPARKRPADDEEAAPPPPAAFARGRSEQSFSSASSSASKQTMPTGVYPDANLNLDVLFNWWHDAAKGTKFNVPAGRDPVEAGRVRDRIVIACHGDDADDYIALNHPIETYRSERFYKELFESPDPPRVGFRDPEPATAGARHRLVEYLRSVGGADPSVARSRSGTLPRPPAAPSPSPPPPADAFMRPAPRPRAARPAPAPSEPARQRPPPALPLPPPRPLPLPSPLLSVAVEPRPDSTEPSPHATAAADLLLQLAMPSAPAPAPAVKPSRSGGFARRSRVPPPLSPPSRSPPAPAGPPSIASLPRGVFTNSFGHLFTVLRWPNQAALMQARLFCRPEEARRERERLLIGCMGPREAASRAQVPVESYRGEPFFRALFESPDPPRVGVHDPEPATPGARDRLVAFLREAGALQPDPADLPPPSPPAPGADPVVEDPTQLPTFLQLLFP